MASVASGSYPSGALVAGNTSRNPVLQDYVFGSGLIQPEHSSWLLDLFPQFRLTQLMDRIGGFSPIKNDIETWSVLGRTRNSAVVSSFTPALPAASTVITTNIAAAGVNLGYFLVGDTIRTEAGAILRVNAVGDAGGFQTITVGKLDGSNILAAELASGESIGHAFNVFPQGSTGPAGRLYLPSEEFNVTQVFRRSGRIDRGSFSNRIFLKEFGVLGTEGESWMFVNEKIEIAEHLRDMENAIMFGVRNTTGPNRTTRGIWDRVVTAGEGQVVSFTAGTGITESDLQTLITRLSRQAGSRELLVLCGSEAMTDIMQALKQYTVNGAVSFGSFGGNTVGLDITSYKFGPFTLNLMHYPLFDDSSLLPFVGTPTATKINFRHVALALDMGSAGERLVSLKYRDGDLGPAKMIHTYIPGMVGRNGLTGGESANSFDGLEFHLLSEIMVHFRGPSRSGALVPNA